MMVSEGERTTHGHTHRCPTGYFFFSGCLRLGSGGFFFFCSADTAAATGGGGTNLLLFFLSSWERERVQLNPQLNTKGRAISRGERAECSVTLCVQQQFPPTRLEGRP